jgi:hypothetical protein
MYVVVYKLSITSPYALIESTTLTYTSADVAVSLCTFNTSVSCITNLAPPVTSSTELAGGILKSFAMYLSVDPVTETQTSIAIAAAVVLVTLIPITASFEPAVNTVTALSVASALYLTKILCHIFSLCSPKELLP